MNYFENTARFLWLNWLCVNVSRRIFFLTSSRLASCKRGQVISTLRQAQGRLREKSFSHSFVSLKQIDISDAPAKIFRRNLFDASYRFGKDRCYISRRFSWTLNRRSSFLHKVPLSSSSTCRLKAVKGMAPHSNPSSGTL